MTGMSVLRLTTGLLAAVVLGAGVQTSLAQGQPPPDHPSVSVRGQTYTPRSILARNMGSEEDRVAQFPPHRIIGNIYYVGTKTLSSFLVVTPEGNILIDSTYERNVPTIEKSVNQLGFKFADTKIPAPAFAFPGGWGLLLVAHDPIISQHVHCECAEPTETSWHGRKPADWPGCL